MAGEFSTWGETARENSSGFLAVQPNLRFQGEYLDRETGLHYNLFRYYDPVSGRFTQVDPIGLAGGDNLYAYAPNPLTWIDPLGLYKGEGQRGLGKYHVFHEHTLDPSEYTLTDKEHFRRANESVYQRLQTDPEFKRTMQTKYPEIVKYVEPS